MLSWIMFQKIYCMYHDINNKEERNADMLLTSTPEHKQAKKVNEELKDSWHNAENQPFLKKINIPSDLTKICSGMEQ